MCDSWTHHWPLPGRATERGATLALKGLGGPSRRQKRKHGLPEEAGPGTHRGGDGPSPSSHLFRVYRVRGRGGQLLETQL